MLHSQRIVETKAGNLRGTREVNFEDEHYFAFRGIPYAKPPVGTLRFRDPEVLPRWGGLRNATFHRPNAPQIDRLTGDVIGSEDCLHLNIYSKGIKIACGLPVMVWIHGGNFASGSGDDSFYGPDYFMRRNVCLVTINYRLGALGFLTFDDTYSPGNQGLKDQVMALKWIQNHIINFSGDPTNVTIFGSDAGAACVHLLCLSPLAKGLFHRAIIQSGVSLNPWVIHRNPGKRAFELCEKLGCKSKDPATAVQFLRKVNVRQLVKAQNQLLSKDEKIQYSTIFGPCIDRKSDAPFMPMNPDELARRGIDMPLIIGYNDREGIVALRDLGREHSRFNTDTLKVLHPNTINTMHQSYSLDLEKVKKIYYTNNSITHDNLESLVDMLGELYFIEGIHRVIRAQVVNDYAEKTYFYKFIYDRQTSLFKMSSGRNMRGACHGDELLYLFSLGSFSTMRKQYCIPRKSWYQVAKWCVLILPLMCLVKLGRFGFPPRRSQRYRITKRMIDMWVNFAITDNPIPKRTTLLPMKWTPVEDICVFNCMKISEDLEMEGEENLELKYTEAQDHQTMIAESAV
ncbi:esterase B1-like [Phymastichus coffea]|uniref:esterase B1-like n=1 Tax=Phymastichus coffea TaxID=108790 RepID=UPI00273C1E30|nr:esterase B1-like [Phymastichus coffea]